MKEELIFALVAVGVYALLKVILVDKYTSLLNQAVSPVVPGGK